MWIQQNSIALGALRTALGEVAIAFDHADRKALTTKLVACANATVSLARTAAGSLAKDQAEAIATIAEQCASMAHMTVSGDATGLAAARPVLDMATATLAATFTAAG